MNIIRTLLWICLTALLVAFMAMNWHRAPVNFWPLDAGYLYFEWPVGLIALAFFALGLVPMWLLHKAGHWRMNRRIQSLENSVRANTVAPPIATTTQLDAKPASEEPAA